MGEEVECPLSPPSCGQVKCRQGFHAGLVQSDFCILPPPQGIQAPRSRRPPWGMKHHDSGRPEPRAAAPAGFVAPEPQLPGRASTRQQPAALAPWREALETGAAVTRA